MPPLAVAAAAPGPAVDREDDALAVERAAIARAQAGDLAALEPHLARHAQALFSSVAMPRLGDAALAEDLVKDTLVQAIEKLGTFRWQGVSLFFWLRRIALHKLVDLHRRRGRDERLVTALEVEANAQPPEGRAADDALIAAEDERSARTRVETAMAAIAPRYAEAIRLRLVEERSREACAEALGVTVNNFDVILFRAVRAFRKAHGER